MKILIVKYWVIVVTILISIFLIFSGMFDSCLRTQSHNLITDIELSAIKQQAIDSVKSAERVIKIAEIRVVKQKDSIETEYYKKRAEQIEVNSNKLEKKNRKLGTQVTKLQHKTDSLQEQYDNDTTTQTLECDTLIASYKQVNDTLRTQVQVQGQQIDTLKIECKVLDREAEGYSKQLYLAEKEIKIKDQMISDGKTSQEKCNEEVQKLLGELNKKDTWLKRNQKWFYIGLGATVSYLILK